MSGQTFTLAVLYDTVITDWLCSDPYLFHWLFSILSELGLFSVLFYCRLWLMSSGSGEPPQAQPGPQSNFSFLCILALRLLKGSSADSKEVTENCKENSKEKELCLDNKKEVGGFVCVDVMVRIKKRMDGNVSPLFWAASEEAPSSGGKARPWDAGQRRAGA